MSLEQYNKKRRFSETPEPKGRAAKKNNKLIFVVQRHNASTLHYDFRLEVNGTLKSWAVPKGPSLYPKDRRLAVHVEDHPLSYAAFEGDIPAGNYGAGHVDIWDKGTYTPTDERGNEISEDQFAKDLGKGHIRFVMHGHNLQGQFSLVLMKGRGENNWLLFKTKDEFAVEDAFSAEDTPVIKSKSQKTMSNAKTAYDKVKKSNTGKPDITTPATAKLKKFIKPMTAKLADAAFDDDNWLFEIKWDGYRAIAEIHKGKPAQLYSRNGISFADDYAAIYNELSVIKHDMVIDGEIVALDEHGEPHFNLLQNAGNTDATLHYYIFDLLKLNGQDCTALPLVERKALLKEALPDSDILRYSDHVVGAGKEFFAASESRGLEGIMAKRCDSLYSTGSRSDEWLKVKHILTDEAIILGYTAPQGSRKYFGALILGMYKAGRLQYIGHTGTGFNTKTLKSLYDKMQPYRRDASPLEQKVKVNAPVQWLNPVLVCAIKYNEVTKKGMRRHPVFVALRSDKDAAEVNGADADQVLPTNRSIKSDKDLPASNKMNHEKQKQADEHILAIGKHKVAITNPDKIYWPEEGYTKGDLLAYYAGIADTILPYLKGRPMSLRRNPNGITDRGFFHKDAGDNVPDFVATKSIWSESSKREVDYIICNNKATLMYLVNLGCIELNPWHSRITKLDKPDYLILDLDPSDGNTFEEVIETAKAVKHYLDKAGAESYIKTSGSTGLHIYVPLGRKYTYEQAEQFAEIIATLTAADLPDITSVVRPLKERGHKIYIDYMQNNIGQTVAAPYSLRPKPGATASAPLEWKEVRKGLSINKFHIKNMVKRIERKGDLFAEVLGPGIDLKSCLKRLGA